MRLITLIACALCLQAHAAGEDSAEVLRTLDEQAQDIKSELLALNRDLFILEEELLFPANTQVAVFVSVDVGEFFALDSVALKLNGKEVGNHLYTEKEVSALHRGGVQRIYTGNLRAGEHELVAIFTGQGPHVRDYRRGATVNIEKGIGAKYLELEITDRVKGVTWSESVGIPIAAGFIVGEALVGVGDAIRYVLAPS